VASVIYLDTHVAAWLFAGDQKRISRPARLAIESHDLLISPAALLELEYLYETRRTGTPGSAVLDDLGERVGLRLCSLPFPDVARSALGQRWTRDPFDRLIVGHAAIRATALLTKDRQLRRHYPHALW
jgi:PIN domain nuclease of toxin-antitoxin system